MKLKEIRDLSEEELKMQYNVLSKEIFEIYNELRVTRKIEKPHLIKLKKRNRARVLTVLREKSYK